MTGQVVLVSIVLCVLVAGVLIYRDIRRKARRRKSLRKEADQGGGHVYVWTEFDGSESRSKKHPDEPGGAWDSDTGGDSGGGGDGGDGGGGSD